LHYTLKERAAELGLPTRGGVANAVVFSPPYCNIVQTCRPELRAFRKDRMTAFQKGSYKAFLYQLVASAYIMLRMYGVCVVVVKQATSTTAKTGQTIPEIVEEAVKAVGFKNIERHVFQLAKPSAFYEYHRERGHKHEHLQYEYVIAGQKLTSAKPEVQTDETR
ncbi:MAG: hypothetical protein QXV62_07835, partial [Nitrososphaerota archaeon]